jgi:CheY-like chemotaxis protein
MHGRSSAREVPHLLQEGRSGIDWNTKRGHKKAAKTMPTQSLARILVIDDQPSVRLGVREILEDAGYEVTEAASADEAMPLLTDGKTAEAIVTDINMPGTLDGLELARMVDGLMPEIAIVIMSGKQLPRREDLPLKATFVAKPFSASMLLQGVAKALVEV